MKNRKWNKKGVSIPIALLVISCVSLLTLSTLYFGIKSAEIRQIGIAGNVINVGYKAFLLNHYIEKVFENSVKNIKNSDLKIKEYEVTMPGGTLQKISSSQSDQSLIILRKNGAKIKPIYEETDIKEGFIENFKKEIEKLRYPYVEYTPDAEYNFFGEKSEEYLLDELIVFKNRLGETDILDSVNIEGNKLIFDLDVELEDFYKSRSGVVVVDYDYQRRFIGNFENNQ